MTSLAWVKGMIIDMDGVIWRGATFLPHVPEFFNTLRENEIRFVLATNNATASPAMIQERLRSIEIEIEDAEILTSAMATAHYLAGELKRGERLYAIGEQGLKGALEHLGFVLSDSADSVGAVVVGMDKELRWSHLAEACLALNAGAGFFGTNPDVSFPTERGQVPGNGAILAALQAATGKQPFVIGKPEPHLYRQAMDHLGVPIDDILVIGDRLETDILGGKGLGVRSLLVLTGVTDWAQAQASEIQADFVCEDLEPVVEWLRRT